MVDFWPSIETPPANYTWTITLKNVTDGYVIKKYNFYTQIVVEDKVISFDHNRKEYDKS